MPTEKDKNKIVEDIADEVAKQLLGKSTTKKEKPPEPVTWKSLKKDFVKTLEPLTHNRRMLNVFGDFCLVACYALSNQRANYRQDREDKYLQVINSYKTYEERVAFAHALAKVVMAYGIVADGDQRDFLGECYMEGEMANKNSGEFFTPYDIQRLMAQLTFDADEIKRKEFITVMEPACGSGGMILAFANVAFAAGVDVPNKICFYAIDVNPLCCQMAYINLACAGLPAVIYHGDSLSNEMWDVFLTPAYLNHCWPHKLCCPQSAKGNPKDFAEWFKDIAKQAAGKMLKPLD